MTADVPQQAVAAAGRRLDSWAARRQAQGSDVPAAAPNGGSGPAAASLSDTCRLLAAAFHSTSTAMAVTTATGLVVQGNAALGALLGCPAGQLLGRQVQDLSDVGDAAAVTAALGRSLQPGVAQPAVSVRLRHTDGGLRPASLFCTPVPAEQAGQVGYLIVHVQQAREWHATGEALVHDALHDPLTALPNRVLLHDRLAGALTRLQRSRSSVALLFADLDGFKAVNDRYGHAAGDQVLVAIAHRLLSVQRAADTVCRYGGDEFVVLCENTSRAQADAVAARLRSALAPAIRLVVGGPDDPAAQVAVSAVLTASIGVAATSDPHTSAEQLLQNADSQMYRAKRSRALPG